MQSRNRIAVLYSQVPHKKVNGTLFYCFEYFIFLSNYTDVSLFIHTASDKDIDDVKNIFRDKYIFDHKMLDNIKPIKGVRSIYSISSSFDRVLFLDIRSANSLSPLINCDKHVYSNKPEKHYLKDVTYYGYYEYQYHSIKEKLKFNFDIFKPIDNTNTNTAFISSAIYRDNIRQYIDIKEDNILIKQPNTSFNNLYELFDTFYYYHNEHDSNNRMIVESFFYNKKVNIIYSNIPKDSVYYRYTDIMNNGIEGYRLTRDDKLIKALLG